MDLISIGITCFNAEESIERAVRSAQAQSWPDIEIVAVDDRSSDSSWAILQRLASADPRLHVMRHDANRGVGAARNTILRRASGAFVAFFDDDDVSDPARLAEQHRRIVAYERATGAAAVVCCTATELHHPDGARRYTPCLGMDATPAPGGLDVARLILLGRPAAGSRGVCPTSSQMARREVYASVGGFDEGLRRHEDTDFNLRAALHGAHFAGLSRALVLRRMTPGADKSLAEERRGAVALIEKHRDVLETWSWYRFSRRWCDLKFAWLEGGARSAWPHAVRLAATSPLKTARKLAWAFPNREHYRRFDRRGTG